MKQHKLSDEQQYIIDKIVHDNENIVVSAKAGSAKSTTCREAADRFTLKNKCQALILTYNANLRQECRTKLEEAHLDSRIKCFTFHGSALKFFLSGERTNFKESLVYDALQSEAPKSQTLLQELGIVFVDEAQDLTEQFVSLLQSILRHIATARNGKRPLLCLVGDPFQQIYKFKSASLMYMMKPELHFGTLIGGSQRFLKASLNISFRLTHNMVNWINEYMHPRHLKTHVREDQKEEYDALLSWWGEGIRAHSENKKGEEVTYIKSDWNCQELSTHLLPIYNSRAPGDVVLVCFSGKQKTSPIWKLTNEMAKRNPKLSWGYYFSDDQEVKKETFTNKYIVSTIQRFRGIGRPVVAVFGLDAFYEKVIPDILEVFKLFYIGVTRAEDHLIVIQCAKLPFLTIRKVLEMQSLTDDPQVSSTLLGTTKKKGKGGKSKGKGKKRPKQKAPPLALSLPQLVQKATFRYARGIRMADLFSFVPYDNRLDRDSLDITHECLESKLGEQEEEGRSSCPEDLYLIQGVNPLTRENVLPLYELALQLAIRMFFEKSIFVPQYEQVFGSCDNANEADFDDIRKFLIPIYWSPLYVMNEGGQCLFRWTTLVQISNAYRTLQNGLFSQWTQIQNYDQFVPSAYLQSLFDESIVFLTPLFQSSIEKGSLFFHHPIILPFFLQNRQLNVYSRVFCQYQSTLLHLAFQLTESSTSVLHALSCIATLQQSHSLSDSEQVGGDATSELPVAFTSQLYCFSPKRLYRIESQEEGNEEDFLLDVISRKMTLPRHLFEIAYERFGTVSIETISGETRQKSRRKRRIKNEEPESPPPLCLVVKGRKMATPEAPGIRQRSIESFMRPREKRIKVA